MKKFLLSVVVGLLVACGSEDSTSAPVDDCTLSGDAQVEWVSPQGGESFKSGETVTVKWKADADQFTGFLIKISADGGETWEIPITESLHTSATGVSCLEWDWEVSSDLLIDGSVNNQVQIRVQDYSDASLRATTGDLTVEP